MPNYRVYNMRTNECLSASGFNSPQDACEALGWPINDCVVKELPEPPLFQPEGHLTPTERAFLSFIAECSLMGLAKAQAGELRRILRKALGLAE